MVISIKQDYLKVTKHFIRESIEMVQIWASRLMVHTPTLSCVRDACIITPDPFDAGRSPSQSCRKALQT